MGWQFRNTGYYFTTRGTEERNEKIKSVIRHGVEHRQSANTIAKTLKDEGISYRRTNMLQDINRAMATEYSRSVGSYSKANAFFDKALDWRSVNKGMTYSQAVTEMSEIYAGERYIDDDALDELGWDEGEYITSPQIDEIMPAEYSEYAY